MSNIQEVIKKELIDTSIASFNSGLKIGERAALEAVLALPEMQEKRITGLEHLEIEDVYRAQNKLRSSIRAAIDQLIQGELGTRDE